MMTVTRGKRHEMEPERDSLSYIDFEDDDQGYRTASGSSEPKDLENWWVSSGLSFLFEAGIVPASDLNDDYSPWGAQLHEEYQLRGAEIYWDWVIDQALDRGFEVYDSETRTELFPGGTRCDGECCTKDVQALLAEIPPPANPLQGFTAPYRFEDSMPDIFEANRDQAEAVEAVLKAFEEWEVEGYFDADEQARMQAERTEALDALRSAEAAFRSVTAVCNICGWVSTKRTDEAEAEEDWFAHAETTHPEVKI